MICHTYPYLYKTHFLTDWFSMGTIMSMISDFLRIKCSQVLFDNYEGQLVGIYIYIKALNKFLLNWILAL